MADSNINIEITEATPISLEIVEDTPVQLEITATGPAGVVQIGEPVVDALPRRALFTDDDGNLTDDVMKSKDISFFGGLLTGKAVKPVNFVHDDSIVLGGIDATSFGGTESFGVLQSIDRNGSFAYTKVDFNNLDSVPPETLFLIGYDAGTGKSQMIYYPNGTLSDPSPMFTIDETGVVIAGTQRFNAVVTELTGALDTEIPTAKLLADTTDALQDDIDTLTTDVGSLQTAVVKRMQLIGTYSFGSDTINFYDGRPSVDIDSYSANSGEILRVRTAGSKNFGGGQVFGELNDFIYYDSTQWKTMFNPSRVANFTSNSLVASGNSEQLQTLNTSTYPSLTEISYVKNVTSAIQTQINGKKTDSMATNKLLGRGTAGTGAIEEITLGTGLSLTGTTLNSSGGGAVSSVNTQTGAVVLDQDDIGDGTTYKQYSATEKNKLAGIQAGAEANSVTPTNSVTLTNKTLTSPLLTGAGAGLATIQYANTASNSTVTLPSEGGSAVSLTSAGNTQTLTNKTLTSAVLNTGVSGTAIDTDGTLASNSDTKLASQKATKTYSDTKKTDSMATNKLLGRGTAGTGIIEEITLGTNLSLSGTTLNASGGSGSPGGSDTQIQFNDGGVFAGDADLTFDKTTNSLKVAGGTGAGVNLEVNGSADMLYLNMQGSQALDNNKNASLKSAAISDATADTITGFDSSKKLVSLATATYPSLTELSYVKGVTSAVQTQITANTTLLKRLGSIIAPTSGDYYSMGGQTTAGSAAGASLSASGKIAFHPIMLEVGTIDRIAVSTSVAAASTWRIGLYKANATTGLPDGQTPFLDAGTLDMNNTAGVQAITISQAITDPGLYWAGILVDAYTAAPTTHNVVYSANSGGAFLGLPQDMSSLGRYRVGRTYSSTVSTGAMPTVPTSSMAWAGLVPRVAVRYT